MQSICSVDGCDRVCRAMGFCISHYNRFKKGQELSTPFEPRQKAPVDGLCTYPGCDGRYLASGYCAAHWKRARDGKDMDVPVRSNPHGTTEERFLLHVDRNGPTMPHMDTPCWLWTGAFQTGGYGQIWDNRLERHRGAHVVAWELANGMPMPEELQVRHACDLPPCVRGDHLSVGTPADDGRDRVERGRSARGSRHGMAKLTEADVVAIREGYETGDPQWVLAARHGVSQTAISAIIARRTWAHVR